MSTRSIVAFTFANDILEEARDIAKKFNENELLSEKYLVKKDDEATLFYLEDICFYDMGSNKFYSEITDFVSINSDKCFIIELDDEVTEWGEYNHFNTESIKTISWDE